MRKEDDFLNLLYGTISLLQKSFGKRCGEAFEKHGVYSYIKQYFEVSAYYGGLLYRSGY